MTPENLPRIPYPRDSKGRLVPIAHIPLALPDLAEQELRRAARDGVKGFWVPPFIWSRKVHGHPDHHGVFAAAEELGLPFGIHPSFEPHWAAPTRFGKMTGSDTAFFQNVVLGNVIREGFTSLFQYGVFDKFPGLRVVILEIGAGITERRSKLPTPWLLARSSAARRARRKTGTGYRGRPRRLRPDTASGAISEAVTVANPAMKPAGSMAT